MGAKRRFLIAFSICAVLAVSMAALLPLMGSASIDYGRAWAGHEPDHQILFELRVPRVLLAMLTGGALALSGVIFQSLLRDSLADAYTLGVSSGASLGAVTAIAFGWREAGGHNPVWLCSFAGASVVLLVVMGIATRDRRLSPFTLLMAGITINAICMAGILFLHSTASFAQSIAITRWLMGGIEPVSISIVGWLALAVLPAVVYCFLHARDWNLLAVGDEWAAARGVPTQKRFFAGYLIGSFLTGSVTALTGPIGFVGLVIPHAIRIGLGADHRTLIPCSFLLGAVFLAVCDTGARTLASPAEIPVGVITAILGGPFFLWMLRAR